MNRLAVLFLAFLGNTLGVVGGRKALTGATLAALIALVGGFEGLRTYAYRDPVGIPTICFGETRGVQMGDTATVEECKAMLGDRLLEFASGVDRCLTVPAPDKPYMAFVSLAYNIGTGAFCKSTVVKRWNAKRFVESCDAILMWNKAGGRVLPGLVTRREAERKLCLEGV
jgi:lysozyme